MILRHYSREKSDEMLPKDTDEGTVFIVYWMSYDLDGMVHAGFERDDCSLIGVYSNRARAEAAVERAKMLPGFRDFPETFLIDRYKLDEDHWTKGFTME